MIALWLLISFSLFLILIFALEVNGYIAGAVFVIVMLIGSLIHFGRLMVRTPMIATKAKVKSRHARLPSVVQPRGFSSTDFSVKFIIPGRKVANLVVSKNQYKALRENDMVDLVYKGFICVSVKTSASQAPIINTLYYSKKDDLSKLMENDPYEIRKRKNKSG